MSDEQALTILEQREVNFYDDLIVAILVQEESGQQVAYVPIRPICDLMGVDRSAQQRRVQRDPVLSQVSKTIPVRSSAVTAPDIGNDSRPKTSYMLALPLDYLNGWLFGMNAERVKPEIKERLIRYQLDCYKVLHQAFQQQLVTAAPIDGFDVDELLRTGQDPEAQAYRMALAIANMARQQLVLRYQIQEQSGRLDLLDQQMHSHTERLDLVEATLGDTTRHISAAQASGISQAVKAIALELGRRSGRNEFGGVYGELYRRFEIAGYRELSANRYDEAMSFLRQWYSSLTDDGSVPF